MLTRSGASEIDPTLAGDPEVIDEDSSRGGTSTEGRGRKIIGLTGPSRMAFAYPAYTWPEDGLGNECRYQPDWNSVGCDDDDFPNTSAATPAVAGAAELFRDWFTTERNAMMDEPGALYASMLLMGDRMKQSETTLPPLMPLQSGFDNLWGAGQLRLRKYDVEGVDNPARYLAGKSCIAQGSVVTLTMNPNITMPQLGVMKATAWWYDRRHDDAVSVDNDQITMRIKENGVIKVSDIGTDNRARVALNNVTPSATYTLEFIGANVTADLEGCGTNSMQIWWAYFWEDSMRDDADDSDYARTE